ncbi:unnamed protein product, partial [Mesorhabditis spiculigera]
MEPSTSRETVNGGTAQKPPPRRLPPPRLYTSYVPPQTIIKPVSSSEVSSTVPNLPQLDEGPQPPRTVYSFQTYGVDIAPYDEEEDIYEEIPDELIFRFDTQQWTNYVFFCPGLESLLNHHGPLKLNGSTNHNNHHRDGLLKTKVPPDLEFRTEHSTNGTAATNLYSEPMAEDEAKKTRWYEMRQVLWIGINIVLRIHDDRLNDKLQPFPESWTDYGSLF